MPILKIRRIPSRFRWAAEETSTNKDTVNRMSSYVKMLSHRKTRQVFLDALKVLGKTIDINGWATAAGDAVD